MSEIKSPPLFYLSQFNPVQSSQPTALISTFRHTSCSSMSEEHPTGPPKSVCHIFSMGADNLHDWEEAQCQNTLLHNNDFRSH
jgi:hypothetical protein